MSQLNVEGGCLCGAVRYSIQGEPLVSGTCQCRSCRKASGAAIVPWLQVDSRHFASTAGRPVEFESSVGHANLPARESVLRTPGGGAEFLREPCGVPGRTHPGEETMSLSQLALSGGVVAA
jgi:Glutathione-dependent formaldehyde-activating enzyme